MKELMTKDGRVTVSNVVTGRQVKLYVILTAIYPDGRGHKKLHMAGNAGAHFVYRWCLLQSVPYHKSQASDKEKAVLYAAGYTEATKIDRYPLLYRHVDLTEAEMLENECTKAIFDQYRNKRIA